METYSDKRAEGAKINSVDVYEIIKLENEMARILEKRPIDTIKHALRGAYGNTLHLLSMPAEPAKPEVRKINKENIAMLSDIYDSLIKAFEELRKQQEGPLWYITSRDISKIEKLYDLSINWKTLGLKENELVMFDISFSGWYINKGIVEPQATIMPMLLNTEHNNMLAKKIVDTIIEKLQTKREVIKVSLR